MGWRAAQARWRELICTHAAVDPLSLDDAGRRRAAREDRALGVTSWGDGFGGGSVVFARLDPATMDERFAPAFDDTPYPVVIFAEHRVTDEDLEGLRGNAWERVSEVPGLRAAARGLDAVRAAFAPTPAPARSAKTAATTHAPPVLGGEVAVLRERLAFYRAQLRQARAFKQMSGAPYHELTDLHEHNLRMEAELLARLRALEVEAPD